MVTAAQVQVLVGARRLDNTGPNIGTQIDVVRIAIHPAWGGIPNNGDVAVWRLAISAPGPYATLAAADPAGATQLLATGWGALTEGGAFPRDLMQVKLPLASRTNCNDANSYNGAITGLMICAGPEAGGRDTCQGDSGGPLTHNPSGTTLSGYTVLVGVTSFGTGCARPNKFGVYARISHPSIRAFIDRNDN